MTFSKNVLDRFLAPGVSGFTTADIPDMSSLAREWLGRNFLNSILRAPYREGARQIVFNFLRRVDGAFLAHSLARTSVARFLSGSRQSLSLYMNGVLHWETYLAQSYGAFDFLVRRLFKEKFFEPGDGSTEQRLACLYSTSKHRLPKRGTSNIWMTDDGLNSEDCTLSWAETGKILEDLAKWAGIVEDPLSLGERLRAELND